MMIKQEDEVRRGGGEKNQSFINEIELRLVCNLNLSMEKREQIAPLLCVKAKTDSTSSCSLYTIKAQAHYLSFE
jgi:hypothetical protein